MNMDWTDIAFGCFMIAITIAAFMQWRGSAPGRRLARMARRSRTRAR